MEPTGAENDMDRSAPKGWRAGRRSNQSAFRDFCGQEAGWLNDYAFFRALMDQNGESEGDGITWPAPGAKNRVSRRARLACGSPLRETARGGICQARMFSAKCNGLRHGQWSAVECAQSSAVSRSWANVPVGVNCHSADVFAQPALIDLNESGGAPPESSFKDDEFTLRSGGQNWGMPLYRWDVVCVIEISVSGGGAVRGVRRSFFTCSASIMCSGFIGPMASLAATTQ